MELTEQQIPYDENSITISDWMLTIFIASLPLVGIIMLFVWAFSNNVPVSKANWAKAMLLWSLIVIILVAVFMVIFGSQFFGTEYYDI